MSQRMVNCVKLGREAPGLEAPPFADSLGQEIYQNVSQEAWSVWQDEMMIKIINEYRLDLTDAGHYDTLLQQMRTWLGLPSAEEKSEVLEVDNPDRGRS